MDEWRGGDGAGRGTGVWPLYVGLFLVLLTFFIMLVGLAEPDFGKTSAVDDNLQARFETRPGSPGSDQGLFAPGASALAELGGDLVGLLRVARVQRAARGEELRVTLPASELFSPDGAELRETCLPFLDRVAATLGAPPGGVRLDLAFSLGVGPAGEWSRGEGGDELPLAVRRRVCCGSRRRSARCSYPAMWVVGPRCAIGSTACCGAGRRTSATAPACRRIARSTITSTSGSVASWLGVTRCPRTAPTAFRAKRCSARSGCSTSGAFIWDRCRVPRDEASRKAGCGKSARPV